MDELVIRHCIFRVFRHGGWGWGGDRRALIDRMTRLAPQLIAARLAALYADHEGVVTEPVRLRISLPARALQDDRLLAETMQGALANAATVRSVRGEAARRPERHGQDTDSSPSGATLSDDAPAAPAAPRGLRSLLLQWRDGGQLLRRLAGVSEATAALWTASLTRHSGTRASAAHQIDSLVAEARSIHDRIVGATREPDRDTGIRLAVVVEMLARHGETLRTRDLAAILDRLARAPESTPARPPAPSGTPLARDQPADARAARGAAATPATVLPAVSPRKSPIGSEVQLTSVLPFLTLGMLARIGWLDVAAASLEAIALPDRGAVLAAALAERLVPRAGPSTREAEARQRTIACFAGLEHAPAPAAFAAWNRVAGDGLGALTGFVADEMAEGHNIEMPLLVSRPAAGQSAQFALFDADGHYPVAVVPDVPSLLILLDRFRASVVLVVRDAATPALIAALNRREQAFVSDAPPGHGERAQRMRAHAGLWCSAHDMPDARIESAAAQFEALVDASQSGLARLLPEPEPNALAVAACLSAAMGLGLLAWKLWRAREQPSPLLALDRLASLDATARLTPDALEIRPAIGRRYLDLQRHGALAEIPGVPWLGGRRIRFAGP